MTKKAWEAKAKEAGKLIDDDDPFMQEYEGVATNAYEDDGNLHIHRFGLHVAFDVGKGQSLNGIEQNERARKVLDFLKLKVTGAALVEEDEDDEDEADVCPHCGRSGGRSDWP